MTTVLRGITWNHPRGIDPLVAASAEFEAATGIRVEWSARPLVAFEDVPADGLAHAHDLLAIDHPSIGDAQRAGALIPLDTLVTREQLADRASDSAGAAHASYQWLGHQWALAIDAACMVSAYRADLVDLGECSELQPDRVLIAANPTHLLCALLSLCESVAPDSERRSDGRPRWWADGGFDRSTLLAGLAALRALIDRCSPDSLHSSPIDVLDRLVSDDAIAYVPLVFQYVTYARERPGRATFVPAGDRGTLTGGVGLAISSSTEHPRAAADFALFASDRMTQSTVFAQSGGQPARESAWLDPDVNLRAGDFFSRTLPTIERSFLRPRTPGYPRFQAEGANTLHAMFVAGDPNDSIAAALASVWERSVTAA